MTDTWVKEKQDPIRAKQKHFQLLFLSWCKNSLIQLSVRKWNMERTDIKNSKFFIYKWPSWREYLIQCETQHDFPAIHFIHIFIYINVLNTIKFSYFFLLQNYIIHLLKNVSLIIKIKYPVRAFHTILYFFFLCWFL